MQPQNREQITHQFCSATYAGRERRKKHFLLQPVSLFHTYRCEVKGNFTPLQHGVKLPAEVISSIPLQFVATWNNPVSKYENLSDYL